MSPVSFLGKVTSIVSGPSIVLCIRSLVRVHASFVSDHFLCLVNRPSSSSSSQPQPPSSSSAASHRYPSFRPLNLFSYSLIFHLFSSFLKIFLRVQGSPLGDFPHVFYSDYCLVYTLLFTIHLVFIFLAVHSRLKAIFWLFELFLAKSRFSHSTPLCHFSSFFHSRIFQVLSYRTQGTLSVVYLSFLLGVLSRTIVIL